MEIFEDIDAWVEAIQSHPCAEKTEIISDDDPRHLRLGYKCTICENSWGIKIRDIARIPSDDVNYGRDSTFRIALETLEGRTALGEAMSR